MFGGCPKFERGKSDDAQQKLANTTVLEFGKQNVHMMLALIQVSEACYWWLIHSPLLFRPNPVITCGTFMNLSLIAG